ncbi:hypothetical protein [Dactylosporangium sp. NPDC051541]|uniref:hypothetical protein n=1 Tax=Dactylosporangium sp. NPDC051541 TaxID=3363977 RepID=UPI0037ABC166
MRIWDFGALRTTTVNGVTVAAGMFSSNWQRATVVVWDLLSGSAAPAVSLPSRRSRG